MFNKKLKTVIIGKKKTLFALTKAARFNRSTTPVSSSSEQEVASLLKGLVVVR